ncbi:hypothetical protein WR25_21745 [Diploscapter pachys]|uniref:Aminopeptidase N-like N-terminal domain-containing protein n=1 Tax=Diploscapter pachys TaxID=2018661 RepID=A0A2A2JH90_9BILA|nr:hypothetical protein WR25_21745 [Diploscapter pachys]
MKFQNQTTLVCGKRSIPATIVHRTMVDDIVGLNLKEIIREKERCRIQLQYSSNTVPFRGLYLAHYPHAYDSNHTTAVIGDFHQLLARRIVPCIDAPASVHKWKVTVLHPTGSTAYFSAKRAFLKTEKGYLKTIFREFTSAPYRLNFALLWDREYRVRKTQTKSGKTIVLRFPTKMSFTYTRFLSVASEIYDFFHAKFGAPFDSDHLDIIIGQHLDGGSLGGSLMILDHMHALETPRLRYFMALTWLQKSDYRMWKDAWFVDGLASYYAYFLDIPKEKWVNTSRSLYQLRQLSENPLLTVPFFHNPTEFDIVQEQRQTFKLKGPLLFHMLVQVLGQEAFDKAVKEVLYSKIYVDHKITDQISKFSPKHRHPKCFRVLVRALMQQSHLPLLKVNQIPGNKVQIHRETYNAPNEMNILWRPWKMDAFYTVPLFEADDHPGKPLKWLDQGVDNVIIDSRNLTLPLDPKGHGLYFVKYVDPRLARASNVANCDAQQRLCVPEGLNSVLCDGSCPSEHTFERLFDGTKHSWDEY